MLQYSRLLKTLERPEKNIFVYGLIDPNTKELKYVGITIEGFRRFQNHFCKKSRFNPVKKWIQGLRENGQIFDIVYLEYFNTDGEHLDEAEEFWISYFKSIGCELLNVTHGRRSFNFFQHADTHRYMSKIMKESHNTPEMKRRISEATCAAMTPEVIAKMSKSAQKPKSVSHAANIKAGQTKKFGLIVQDETGRIFNSLQEAADFYGMHKSTVQKAVYGAVKSAHGHTFTRIGGGRKDPKDIKTGKI